MQQTTLRRYEYETKNPALFRSFCCTGTFGVVWCGAAFAGTVSGCAFKGIKLYGKVQVVDVFPDLKVQKVSSSPNSCGKWQFVDAFSDFKIQYVDAFPGIKIQFVDAFPGMP